MRIASLSLTLLLGVGAWADDPPKPPTDLAEARAQLDKAREAFDKALARVTVLDVDALADDVHTTHFEFEDLFGGGDDAMLGVVIRDHDDGVHVAAVTPDSGAEAAGILADDVIVAINGKVLATEADPGRSLRQAMEDVEAGETVAIAFVRDGEEHDVDVVATARAHPARSMRWRMAGPMDPKAIHFFGGPGCHIQRRVHRAHPELELVDIGEDLGKYFGVDSGVLVLDTPPGSNLKPGDILRRIDDADIRNADEAYRLLADHDEDGTASIRRENRTRNVKVEPVEGKDRHFNIIMRGHEDSGQEVEEEIEVELETTDEE
ncbi:MAG: PDZ domain-containing protein [Gammaproteobacteria bacterium]|nr:PDZ domain-containing protein [Gammaproteobacteria bacterium]